MWDNFEFFMMVVGYPFLCHVWWKIGLRKGIHVTLDFMESEGLVKFEPDGVQHEKD